MKVYVEQVNDGKVVFEKLLDFKDRDALQEAQNEAIANWIDMQGDYTRIISDTDGNLTLKCRGTTAREIWMRVT